MARADIVQFLTEWKAGGKGSSHEIMAVIVERYRNSVNTSVGMTQSQANDIMTAMGYSASAKTGLLDIFNAMVAGQIDKADFESALLLAEGSWPHHTTPAEIADRVRKQ